MNRAFTVDITFVAVSDTIGSSHRGTQRILSENICSEDDLRSVVKFLACLPLLGFSNILKNGIIAHL